MSQSSLQHIPLSAIRENPSALRGVNRQEPSFVELVDSVRSRGVMNPIVVRKIEGEDGAVLYGLVDGLQRYTASLEAGIATVPAQVLDLDDAAAMEAQLIGNVHRVETKPVEYSRQLQKILAMSPLMTMTQLANKLNKSAQWLNERLGLTKLSPAISKLVDDGKIKLTNAYMLAKLPDEEQANFTDRAMSMTPQEFTPVVLARKKELDTAKRQGRNANPAEFIPVAHLQRLGDLKTRRLRRRLNASVSSFRKLPRRVPRCRPKLINNYTTLKGYQ